MPPLAIGAGVGRGAQCAGMLTIGAGQGAGGDAATMLAIGAEGSSRISPYIDEITQLFKYTVRVSDWIAQTR